MTLINRIFGLFFVVGCISAQRSVPVLIWNNHESVEVSVPAVSALQQLTTASLQARYFDAFQPKNVLLFLQDVLSVEDLSSYGSEMPHIKKRMEAHHSLYLPSITEPGRLEHELVQQGYKVVTLAAGSAVSELRLDPETKNLVVVKLPPTSTNPSRSRALRKADEVMESVLEKVGDMADFTVVYTALKPSVDKSGGSPQHSRVARSLNQFGGDETPSNFHNGTCVYVYLRKNITISVTGTDGPHYPILESSFKDVISGGCHNNSKDKNNQSIGLNYGNVLIGTTTYYKVKLMFMFVMERQNWRSRQASVSLFQDANSQEDRRSLVLSKWNDDSIPVGLSYACNDKLVYTEQDPKDPNNPLSMVVEGVQVQPFVKLGATQFGQAWDCVGFFSIPIWEGLLTVLLALIILSVGMYMISDIKTMDRFDDPKGKTIMIPQGD